MLDALPLWPHSIPLNPESEIRCSFGQCLSGHVPFDLWKATAVQDYSVLEFDGQSADDVALDEAQVAIVVSRYHQSITEKMLIASIKTLIRDGVPEGNIHVARVPGTWEISLATERMLETENYDAIICLGCVVKGETTHDQHINTMVSSTLGEMALDYSTPVAFGVLTCNTMDQAIQRSGGSVGNKGVEAAEAAIEMMRLLAKIGEQ